MARLVGSVLVVALMVGAAVCVSGAVFDLAPLGGCASGGSYVIADPCPDSTGAEVPIGIAGVVAAFLLAAVTSRGFGPSPYALALPLVLLGGAATDVAQVVAGRGQLFGLIPTAVCGGIGVILLVSRASNGALPALLVGERSLRGAP